MFFLKYKTIIPVHLNENGDLLLCFTILFTDAVRAAGR